MESFRCKYCGNIHPGQPCAAQPAKFVWPYGGKIVNVYGSWNKFQIKESMLKKGNKFECQVSLAVGEYEYKFEVDGQWYWNEQIKKVSDNLGSFNNIIQVLPKRAYQIIEIETNKRPLALIRLFEEAQEVLGSWDNWQVPVLLKQRYNNYVFQQEYYTYLDLPEGQYQFIFKRKDNSHFHDIRQPSIPNSFGGFNNIFELVFNKTEINQLDYQNVTWQKFDFLYHKFDTLYGHSMTSVGNALYVFGGVPSSNEIYKLDFTNQSMKLLEDVKGEIPRPRAYHNAVAYGDKILFFGGVDENSVLNDHFVFISSTNSWHMAKTEGKYTQRERTSLTFYAQEELVVYFGGYYASPDLEVEEIYNDVYYMNIQNMKWIKLELQNPPQARYGHTATQINEKMYVFGGTNQHQYFNDMWILDFHKQEWTQAIVQGQAPINRYGHTATLIKSKICIYGGRNMNGQRLSDIYFFDFHSNTWIEAVMHGHIPAPRYFHAADVHNEEALWVMGGNIGLKQCKRSIILQTQRTFLHHDDRNRELGLRNIIIIIMKFTHYLLQNLIPEWIKLYLNFKFLKTHLSTSTLVKKILRKTKKHKSQEIYSNLKKEIIANEELIQKLESDRNSYVEIFDDECEKIICFSEWKYRELLVQFEQLKKQIKIMLYMEHQTKENKVMITWNLKRKTLIAENSDKLIELSVYLQEKEELLGSAYKFYIECQQLLQYVQINSEGIRKILKKYKKQEMKGIRNQMIELQHFGKVQSLQKELQKFIKKLDSLKQDTEHQMIHGYYQDDPSICRDNLRKYTTTNEIKHIHICLFGFFGGAAFILIIIIIAMRFDGLLDPNSDKVFNNVFPCFRGMALFLTYYWFISLDLAGWNYFNINYKLYLGFNYHFSTLSEVLQRVSIFTAIYLVIFVWYCVAVEESLGDLSKLFHFMDLRYLPLIMWVIMGIYVFAPLRNFNSQGRSWMYKMFRGALWGHFIKYESRYTFFTDQFTSMITGMRDLDYTFCYYNHLIFIGIEHNGECKFNKRFTAAQASIIPYFLKCIQYITRARDKGKYLWTDEMWNFIKTFIAMSVGILAFLTRLNRDFLPVWVVTAIVCSIYENWWDLKKDFMLFESDTKYRFLRKDLGYNNPYLYYSLCVVNFFLRIAWVLTISPDMYRILGVHNELFILLFGFIEMSRRLLNNFLKMEKEHITNLRNLKTVQELNFPFKDQTIELDEIKLDPYSQSISPLFPQTPSIINSPQVSQKISKKVSYENIQQPLIDELSRIPSLYLQQGQKSHYEIHLNIPRNISFQDYLATRLTNKNQTSFRLTQMLDQNPHENLAGYSEHINYDIVRKAQLEEKLMQTKQDQLKKENKKFKKLILGICQKYQIEQK